MHSQVQAVAQRLAAFGTGQTFATRFTVDADPQLHVEGVGEIVLPVTLKTAHGLCAAAQPAHHGFKDQTRLDPRVRDTWEIPAHRLRFTSPKWTAVLDRALRRIGGDLGLPPEAGLRAELHNLLVYAPGQFFSVHQDSEKAEGMLGTLVITLPSAFTGGEFVVSHQGKTLRTRGSARQLSMMAFYADCHHEVRPVKQGYRVVLTYNLLTEGAMGTTELPAQAVAALAEDVRRFWQTPPPSRWHGDRAEPPDRLVYLLDHQYTASGLSWKRLKGVDVERAAALREAASRLNAEIFLALADVHEIWSAEDNHRPYAHWDAEEEDFASGHDPVPGELIDDDVELRHLMAPDESVTNGSSRVDPNELCMNRQTVDCTPFQSEYEGYMGNYGNTIDRWYHRAAVVMWPRARAFVIRARHSPCWAITQIADRLDAGDAAGARELALLLIPLWEQAVGNDGDDILFATTLLVAASLDDAETAASLLAPFTLSQLTAALAPALLQLLDRHGMPWCMERLAAWAPAYWENTEELAWIAQTLPTLVQALGTSTTAASLSSKLTEQCWKWLSQHLKYLQMPRRPSERATLLARTCHAWLGLIRASRVAGDAALAERIIAALCIDTLPLQVPLKVLRLAAKAKQGTDLTALHHHCTRVISARLAHPARAQDDWSIAPPLDLDATLGEQAEPVRQFLASPQQRRMEWAAAQRKRQIIERFIDQQELPVHHETLRVGSPHTLVLEKTEAVFTRDAAQRRQFEKDLAWLTANP